ncbi:MAG: leucine-rich repeat domain-containing protein [Clostridia bacterium]|nr:leucine-rich repeat domain-containing protein [Clostridia bacterium]
MLKKILALFLALALCAPAFSLAEEGENPWKETEILVLTQEKYKSLFERMVENGANKRMERKFAPLFKQKTAKKAIAKCLETQDGDSWLFARRLLLLMQAQGAESAGIDALIAAGDEWLVTGDAAALENASGDAGLEEALTRVYYVYQRDTLDMRTPGETLREFLDLCGYTEEEYRQDMRGFGGDAPMFGVLPDGTAALIAYEGDGETYDVPAEYASAPVTVIARRAFANRDELVSVTLPDTLRSIGFQAFAGCQGLKSIAIPDGVTEIGEGAFVYCRVLEEVTLPRGITKINDFTFAACHGLQRFNIPENVRAIGMSAFSLASVPADLVIPGNVETVGENSFSCVDTRIARYVATATDGKAKVIAKPLEWHSQFDDPSWIGYPVRLTVENGVRSIDQGAFAGRRLESVSLPGSVTEMGAGVFETDFENPHPIISVDPGNPMLKTVDGAFYDQGGERLLFCFDRLDESVFTVPEGTRIIAGNAFSGMEQLTEVRLPEGVTTLEDRAFYNCEKLSSLTLPASLAEIGVLCFAFCNDLQEIEVAPGNPVFRNMDGALVDRDGKLIRYAKKTEAYAVPDGIRTIGNQAFTEANGLTSLTLPDSLIALENSAFYGCSALESLTIPAGVTEISDYAFNGLYSYDSDESRIRVYAGSYAEQFCTENGIPYELAE